MKLSELIAAYGDDKVQFQNLDQSAISMNMNGGHSKITFGSEQPLTLDGTAKLGLVVWLDRARVKEIVAASKQVPAMSALLPSDAQELLDKYEAVAVKSLEPNMVLVGLKVDTRELSFIGLIDAFSALIAAWNRRTAPVGGAVAWQRCHPTEGWLPVDESDIPHYRKQGQEIRPLYTAPSLPTREDVARVIDPEDDVWSADKSEPRVIRERAVARQDAALAKASAILALMGQTGDGWQDIASAPKAIVYTNNDHLYGEWFIARDRYNNPLFCRWWECPRANNYLDRGGVAVHPVIWMPFPPAPPAKEGR